MKQSVPTQAVKVYIVTQSHGSMFGIETLKIIIVQPLQQAAFLQQYAGWALVEGASIGEVLLKFSKWLNE